MNPAPLTPDRERKPQRPPYRPPVGIPIREEGKKASAIISIVLHVLIIGLLLAPPLLIARQIQINNEGAGGPGPASIQYTRGDYALAGGGAGAACERVWQSAASSSVSKLT